MDTAPPRDEPTCGVDNDLASHPVRLAASTEYVGSASLHVTSPDARYVVPGEPQLRLNLGPMMAGMQDRPPENTDTFSLQLAEKERNCHLVLKYILAFKYIRPRSQVHPPSFASTSADESNNSLFQFRSDYSRLPFLLEWHRIDAELRVTFGSECAPHGK